MPTQILLIISSAFLSSCTNPKASLTKHEFSRHVRLVSKDQEIARKLQDSPFNEKLDPDFYEKLKNLEGKINFYQIAKQIGTKVRSMPLFKGLTIPLIHKSKFDNHKTNYQFIASPKTKSNTLVIVMGDKESLKEIPSYLNTNFVYIPSRASMNYHFLAEADFWGVLEDLYFLYPQLQSMRHFLLADHTASDAALLLANNYPGRFDALAYTGGSLGLKLSNLDNLSIIHYEDQANKAPKSPWGGKKLIQRLRQRGNSYAKSINSGFKAAVNELLKTRETDYVLKNFQFEDEQFAKVNSSMEILAKKIQGDPVNLSAKIKGKTIVIDAENIRALFLQKKGKLKEMEQIVFNGQEQLFEKKSKIVSESFFPKEAKTKAPTKLAHYFCNEALFIVYQDQFASEEFLKTAKEIASRFAKLDFFGLPKMPANLSLLSLSEYQRIDAPEHRIIAVGNPSIIPLILSKDPSYLPIYEGKENLAFSLSYPPQNNKKCKMVFSLIADKLQGLETLARHYHYATSLYENADLKLWVDEGSGYFLLKEELFNSFWQRQEPSQTLLYLPFQTKRLWKAFIKDLLIDYSGSNKWLLEPFFHQYLRPPERLSFRSLDEMLPEKHFAKIRLKGMAARNIGNKLLKAITPLEKNGLARELIKTNSFGNEDFLFKEIKKPLEILVEAQGLEVLDQDELKLIDYEILPLSLRELFLDKIKNDREGFAKKILRLAKLLELD